MHLDLPDSRAQVPTSAQDAHRFTPDHYRTGQRGSDGAPPPFREGAPVYLMRVPTGRTRARLHAALGLAEAQIPSQRRVLETMREGIRDLVAPAQQDEAIAILDRFERAPHDGEMSAAEQQELVDQVTDIERQLADAYRPLWDLWVQRSEATARRIVEQVRYYVVGWEGLDAQPAFTADALTQEAVNAIPDDDQLAIAGEVGRLSQLSEGQRKNSASPSSP